MINSNLIYDVGAHKGEDTDFYLNKGFHVIAIEAVPEFCASLEERFRKFVTDGKLKILNIAVSERDGSVDFYMNLDQSVWGTTKPNWVARNKILGAGNTKRIVVPSRPLVDVMREHGVPRYCKIDIEGNDLDALKSLIGSPELPPFISVESEKRNWNLLLDELVTFHKLGYTKYKVVDQTLVSLQSCPKPAREGEYCAHVFQSGSSGLFGDELPGRWVTLADAVETYRSIFIGYALNGDNGMFRLGQGIFSIFSALGALQARLVRLRGLSGYSNPAHVLPHIAWYDTHAAR